MSFLRALADHLLKWISSTEAECRAFRRFPDDARYRCYSASDEAECVAIYRALESGFPDEGIEEFLKCLRRTENGIIVAERAGRVVGMGGISLAGSNTAIMYYGLVAPDQQGLGIGTALALLRLCSLPPSDLPPTVFIWTLKKPQHFYRRFGFRTYHEWDDSKGGKHPAALLDLTGFRPDFTLGVLRRRNVVLEGELIPRRVAQPFLDKIRLPDGATEYRVEEADERD